MRNADMAVGRTPLRLGAPLVALALALAASPLACDDEVVFLATGGHGASAGGSPVGGGGSGAGSTSTTTSTSSGTTSSTTATGTSTGSETTTTSTTTWGPGVCNVGSCEDCLAGGCTQTACEAEIATCDATPDCPDLFDCIWSCSSDLCQEQCMSLYPTGYDPLMALFTCEHCYACFDDCDPDCPVVY